MFLSPRVERLIVRPFGVPKIPPYDIAGRLMSTDHLLADPVHEDGDEKICYESPIDPTDGQTQDHLIYFIPGNPGLVSYYRPFLSNLHSQLSKNSSSSSSKSTRFHICGHSYRGFEVDQNERNPKSPLGLEEQIIYQENLLYRHVNTRRGRFESTPRVILMGHSVGAYVLLELIQRHRKKVEKEGEEDFDLIGGVLLFPTITHIAQSPLGLVASVSLDIKQYQSDLN